MDLSCCILTLTSIFPVLATDVLDWGRRGMSTVFVGGEKHIFNSINYDSKAVYINEVEVCGFFFSSGKIKVVQVVLLAL